MSDAAVCWRCNGTGFVTPADGTDQDTPCGACLGTKVAAKPCLSCGGTQVKVFSDGSGVAFWCRDCMQRGPWAPDNDGHTAMKLWNDLHDAEQLVRI